MKRGTADLARVRLVRNTHGVATPPDEHDDLDT
jgi:hypothetical protein